MMTTPTAQNDTAPSSGSRPGPRWGLLLLVVAAGIIVYINSFPGVFLFDDLTEIVTNKAVHDFDVAQLRRGRPLANFTLALNHRVGGFDVAGYHAVNLLVHLLAACTLFGLVRRTLMLPRTRERFNAGADWVAGAIALLWVVHPLLTESVTYISERAEALAGLFYLLTLYCVARGGAGGRSGGGAFWYVLAVVACGLGMGSKAVVVTAPIVALLYDRIFVAESLGEILRRRWALYAGLATTWGVLFYSGVIQTVFFPGDAEVSMGFGYDGITPLAYLGSQFGVVLHYIRLGLWPAPLCFDYWWLPARGGALIGPAIGIVLLLAVTSIAIVKRPRVGFLGAAFFLLLFPTSSFIPFRELASEHRMYLALVPLLALPVLAVYRFVTRPGGAPLIPAAVIALLLVAAGLGATTIDRNRDYHSAERMWRDVVTKRPLNPRAPNNLGAALVQEERLDEALVAFAKALEFPEFRDRAYLHIGQVQRRLGNIDPAIEAYTLAVAADPSRAAAHHTLANLLVARGRIDEAVPYFNQVLTIEPTNAEAHADFGRALAAYGRLEEAGTLLSRAVQLSPENAQAHNNLGGVFAMQGRMQEALASVIEAVRLDPDYTEALDNLGRIMVRSADPEAIVERNRDRVNLEPAFARTLAHQGDIALSEGRRADAIALFERALRIVPDLEQARAGLARAIAFQQK